MRICGLEVTKVFGEGLVNSMYTITLSIDRGVEVSLVTKPGKSAGNKEGVKLKRTRRRRTLRR